MQLRDHHLICCRGIRTWPPIWSNLTRGGGDMLTLNGEVGILAKVRRNEVAPNVCFLHTEYDGESYCGALLVDNPEFAEYLVAFLEQHVGKSIKEIGDLDLSHTL